MNKLLCICLLFLCSCNHSTDPEACLQSVKDTFPNATINKSATSNYTFVVMQDSSVFIIQTLDLSSPSISEIYVMTKIQ